MYEKIMEELTEKIAEFMNDSMGRWPNVLIAHPGVVNELEQYIWNNASDNSLPFKGREIQVMGAKMRMYQSPDMEEGEIFVSLSFKTEDNAS